MLCSSCGKEITELSTFCPHCGARQNLSQHVDRNDMSMFISSKSRLAATLLCLFLGFLGIHRFYVGKIGTGILWLFTLGFLGIGSFIDLLLILTGNFVDKQGKILEYW